MSDTRDVADWMETQGGRRRSSSSIAWPDSPVRHKVLANATDLSIAMARIIVRAA